MTANSTAVTRTDLSSKSNDDLDQLDQKHPRAFLKCVVCGDTALGKNFDAISCESCKAFFRRTALRPSGKLKCRGNDHCEVTVEKRKRCKRCRLDKCFQMGMRKEWILTPEEKQKKRKKIEDNRRQKEKTTISNKEISNYYSMNPSDWSRIHQVQFAYSESISLNKVIGVATFPASQQIYSTIDLIRIPTYLASIRLITFLKKIPEFNQIDLEDRVTLVKYNLLAVVFMHVVLIYNSTNDTYHEPGTEDPIFEGKDWIKILGEEFYRDLTNIATQLIQTVHNDRIIIKTFLLLILLSKGFCAYDIAHEPNLTNSSLVYQAQNSYVESLYKYCLHHHGFNKTITIFRNLTGHLFRVQNLAVHLKDYVHDHIDASQISPLMQTVLQLNDSITSM